MLAEFFESSAGSEEKKNCKCLQQSRHSCSCYLNYTMFYNLKNCINAMFLFDKIELQGEEIKF